VRQVPTDARRSARRTCGTVKDDRVAGIEPAQGGKVPQYRRRTIKVLDGGWLLETELGSRLSSATPRTQTGRGKPHQGQANGGAKNYTSQPFQSATGRYG
jgi:hypothetical protein